MGSPLERPMHVFETLRGRTRLRLRATPGDLAFEGLSTFIALAVVGLLVLITVILYLAAAESIRTSGLGFLSGSVWDSVSQRFGAAPFIYGMLVTSALALLLGVPVSLGIAIFLSELSPAWLRIPLTFIVELLAAVPSVVYGLWGICLPGPAMRVYIEPGVQAVLGFLPLFQGHPIGSDVFTAGVILALMIIPTISAVSRDALLTLPDGHVVAALILGSTAWETHGVRDLRH